MGLAFLPCSFPQFCATLFQNLVFDAFSFHLPLFAKMNSRALFRTVVFLLLLFVVLYIGMENRQQVGFYFPLLLDRKISAPAAILYFAMFAIGVLAGMALHSGGGGHGGGGSESKKRK